MTRINSAISPKNLTDQHLIAELRELPRIFTAVNKRIENDQNFNDIPEKFTLGTGHVRFFYNKLSFLEIRHLLLKNEYRIRFNKDWQYSIDKSNLLPKYLQLNLYVALKHTDEEKQLLIDRISTRIMNSNQIPRYYGKAITKEQVIEILKS